MLLNRDGLAWIGRRSQSEGKRPSAGSWWQMPQGGIDDGEDPALAAMRELQEETGVTSAEIIGETAQWLTYDLPPELLGKVWKGRYRGQRQKWFAMKFTGSDEEINLDNGVGGDAEFDAWRWAALGEVSQLIVPFKRTVYDRVITELGQFADMR